MGVIEGAILGLAVRFVVSAVQPDRKQKVALVLLYARN